VAEERVLTVAHRESGRRLDQFLSARVTDLSRSRLQRLIDEGHVLVDGEASRRSRRMRGGEAVVVVIPDPTASELVAEAIPLDIEYEDGDLLVVHKPAGMVVHPTQHDRSGTLVNALLAHCDDLSGIGGVERPGIVHRLDKLTSGLLLVAKNDLAHGSLAEQFHDHTVTRRYEALVWGMPLPSEGRIASEIGRHPTDRKRMSSRAQHGKHAVTLYRVLEPLGPVSRTELVLETGRTHQIRVHMSERLNPVVGDPVYGGHANRRMPDDPVLRELLEPIERQLLHARTIGFDHPRSGEYLSFERPPPEDHRRVVDGVRARLAALA
jgi:23S rRNA pseudouridine1911/1915/1917 synthase